MKNLPRLLCACFSSFSFFTLVMPNMMDDVRPGLPDTYGGDVHIPALNKVAKSGISFSRFHTTAICSSTRTSLLAGRNHYRFGRGTITHLSNDWDGYTGHLPATTSSIAKVLGSHGCTTNAIGRWHNTPVTDVTKAGPFERWPVGRIVGVDYLYRFLASESSQWEPSIVENLDRIESPKNDGYHFTEDMVEKSL